MIEIGRKVLFKRDYTPFKENSVAQIVSGYIEYGRVFYKVENKHLKIAIGDMTEYEIRNETNYNDI